MKQNKVYGAILVVALFALGIVYMYYTLSHDNLTDNEQLVPPQTHNAAVMAGKPTTTLANTGLSVSTQTAGRSVTIDAAKIASEGFIAIFENNNGKPGKLIGNSALLKPGDKQDLEIRATISAGKTYMATLYKDDGSKSFDVNKDAVVLDSKGQALSRTFSVQ